MWFAFLDGGNPFVSRKSFGPCHNHNAQSRSFGRAGRRRYALARPSLELGKSHEFGRDEGFAKSGARPYRISVSTCGQLLRFSYRFPPVTANEPAAIPARAAVRQSSPRYQAASTAAI